MTPWKTAYTRAPSSPKACSRSACCSGRGGESVLRKSKTPKPIEKGVASVPVVMQMEALECGAASLTMIMHYYRKWIPLEQAR
ncbi:MAG: hypothetical protein IKX84_02660, partial [Clostridia bacterium]|nr:hypothetical protein [Clostridia bacterium]